MNLNPHIFTITLYANMLHLKDRNCQDRYNRKNFSPEKQWTNEGHPSMKLRNRKHAQMSQCWDSIYMEFMNREN